MSYIFTNNMIHLRGLTWYSTKTYSSSSSSSSGFVDTSGNTFTGYFYSNSSYANGYSASILAYAPIIYISSDKASLSREDYAIPDDAIQVSYTTTENATVDDNGISTVVYAYYTNDTDSAISINKILIAASIGTSNGSNSSSALLFEELLDQTITLQAGERFARNFEFRLEVA